MHRPRRISTGLRALIDAAGVSISNHRPSQRGATFRPDREMPLSATPKKADAPPPLAFPLWPCRRKPWPANQKPGKAVRRTLAPLPDMPTRPETHRQKAIRTAWAAWDWHTLKAFGEIDAIPEP